MVASTQSSISTSLTSPTSPASATFPSAVGRAFHETENVNRDKTRQLRLMVENHHTSLQLAGVQFHCEKGNCVATPYHTVGVYGAQVAEFSAAVPNAPCSGYVLYRVVAQKPTANPVPETFILLAWRVPVVGANRFLLEVLQAEAAARLLRHPDAVKVAVRERCAYRMLPANFEQRQGWNVGQLPFVVVARMNDVVDAEIRLGLHATRQECLAMYAPPEMICPPSSRVSLEGAQPLRSPRSTRSLKSLSSNDSRRKSQRRRTGLAIVITNQSTQIHLRNPRIYSKDGRLDSTAPRQMAPFRRGRIEFTASSKLQGCLVYEMCTPDNRGQLPFDGSPAAYRGSMMYLLLGWYVHPRRGNRLCVDVVRARSDLFPGNEHQYGEFYEQYVKQLMSTSARPSVWRTDSHARFALDAMIDAGVDMPELSLNLRAPQLESDRDEAPLFLPSTGFSVTMSGSLAALAERFSRRTSVDQRLLTLVVENHHHRVAMMPVWPADRVDQRLRQGDFELATLNSSLSRWSTEGLRIYRLSPRNVSTIPLLAHYLVVRARDSELSIGTVATWSSTLGGEGVQLEALLNYVRFVPGMDCLPMSRRVWRTVRVQNATDFALSAFRSATAPPVLTLMLADAQAARTH
ncbi:hypothetical protein THASP1DRAFT_31022 [Thamnocephalis sphaerospora]|uniref:Uncharacterized protein n=1 Tax=Thamnocephalis sphaerospora TaxID=78915 RepID=A0A4P9XMW7_9FUNG|nr:hypothetical protein THASP1DRAFT_31022 [Thamnocephalis sphaerospora]|eukprot:RKP07152.1 hypothetical protein THASP1DRAFT_31022 [Thamnocephalis sphaerospora]